MKSLLGILLLLSFAANAQYGNGGMGGMGGGRMHNGGGMHGGSKNYQGHEFHKSGGGNYFVAVLKDGTKVSGSGIIKIKNGISTLELKTADEKEFVYTPLQLTKLTHTTRAGLEDYINFENKYWLCKLSENVDAFYQVDGDDELIFMKDKDKFRLATKDDIIDLVKDDKDAYKYAKKGQIKKSLQAYIGTNAPASFGLPEKMDSEKKQRPLFNAQ